VSSNLATLDVPALETLERVTGVAIPAHLCWAAWRLVPRRDAISAHGYPNPRSPSTDGSLGGSVQRAGQSTRSVRRRRLLRRSGGRGPESRGRQMRRSRCSPPASCAA